MVDTPRLGHEPISMQRVTDEGEIDARGQFAWKFEGDARYLVFAEPNARTGNPESYMLAAIPVRQELNETGKHWGWDGNEDKPTLTPSVHSIGHWHGWVRDGVLVEA